MVLERVKEILVERGFTYDELGHEDLGDMIYEVYCKINNISDRVEFTYSPKDSREVLSIFISNPYYDFGNNYTDDQKGVTLGKEYNEYSEYEVDENLFKYCLDIQENPSLHEMNFCRAYLEFSEWRNKEFMPVVKYFDLYSDEDLGTNEVEEYYFRFETKFYFESDDIEQDLSIGVGIDPLTLKPYITVYLDKAEDMSALYGEPSGIIISAIEDFKESDENALPRPSNP